MLVKTYRLPATALAALLLAGTAALGAIAEHLAGHRRHAAQSAAGGLADVAAHLRRLRL